MPKRFKVKVRGAFRKIGRGLGTYTVNNLSAVDRLGNSLTGGHPSETWSSRMGRSLITKSEHASWRWVRVFTNWAGRKLAGQKNHVLESIDSAAVTRRLETLTTARAVALIFEEPDGDTHIIALDDLPKTLADVVQRKRDGVPKTERL